MNSFFPQTLGSWIFFLIGVMGAVATFLSQRRKDVDTTEAKVILLYKEQLGLQDKKILTLQMNNEKNEKQIAHLTTENGMIKEILLGKDKASIEIQKQAIEAMSKVNSIEILTIRTDKNVADLVGLLERHLQIIEKKLGTESTS